MQSKSNDAFPIESVVFSFPVTIIEEMILQGGMSEMNPTLRFREAVDCNPCNPPLQTIRNSMEE
jgi:hypothetical protein